MKMKQYFAEFVRRGMSASGFGPVVLAILYLTLQKQGALEILTVNQVCTGIFSLSALAFAAGGMNVIYQIERIPLMAAVLIHGSVLYFGYLFTYLLNDWINWGISPILYFTVIFVLGYLLIWAVIYLILKRNTKQLNQMLEKRRETQEK